LTVYKLVRPLHIPYIFLIPALGIVLLPLTDAGRQMKLSAVRAAAGVFGSKKSGCRFR